MLPELVEEGVEESDESVDRVESAELAVEPERDVLEDDGDVELELEEDDGVVVEL
jgi:hypothetical protein